MADVDALIGQMVADRYRLERVLGTGGMAAVYAARRVDDGEAVAVKLLLDDRSRSVPRRFAMEARLASRIRHPHVVGLLDFGRDRQGRLFLALELVDGVSVDVLRETSLGTGAYCTLAVQVLDALAHVHARGVLHRDIKPENLLVVRRPSGELVAKVADFGIAAAMGEEAAARVTDSGFLVGTPDFMAPEQVENAPLLGPPVDIYAVGVTLYELLSGRTPFGGSVTERLFARLHAAAPPVTARDGLELPAGLVAVVARMLARRPERRYGTAADARAALLPFCGEATLGEEEWEAVAGPAKRLAAGEAPEVGAGLEREARLFGRQDELATLDAVANEVEEGQGRVVLLAGDAGVGKSMLVHELGVDLAESGRFQVIHGSYQQAAGLEAGLRGAFERMLGVSGRDVPTVEAGVRELLRQYGDVDEEDVRAAVDFLRPGEHREAVPQHESFALAVRLLRRLARVRPVLLALDDLHEGGGDAAAFIEYLLFETSYEPFRILLVGTFRPKEGDDRFERALVRTDRYEGGARRLLRIEPLRRDALAEALVQRTGLGWTDAYRVARRAGGNPMFGLLLAQTPVTTQPRAEQTTAALRLSDVALPEALRSVLERSLRERLQRTEAPEAMMGLLARMAVAGERIAFGLLEELGDGLLADVDDAVDRLIELEVLVESGPDAVAFSHGLLRDTLLAGLSARKLRRHHRDVAEARERFAGDRAGAEAGPIGDHLAAAGERERAVEWWQRALAHESAAGDAGRGVEWGRRLLASMDPHDPGRAQHTMDLARLLRDIGEVSEAAQVLEPLVDEPVADTALAAGELLAEMYQELGRGTAWAELVDRMRRRLDAAGAPGRRAFLRTYAFWLNNQGRPVEARAAAEEALSDAPAGSEAVIAAVRLAWACKFAGDLDAARRAAARAVADAEGRPALRAEALRIQAFVEPPRCGPPGIVSIAREALELSRRTGRAGRVVRAISDMATAMMVVGDHESALARFDSAARFADELGMSHEAMRTRLFAIICRLETGNYAGAVEELEALEAKFSGGGARSGSSAAAWSHAANSGGRALRGSSVGMNPWLSDRKPRFSWPTPAFVSSATRRMRPAGTLPLSACVGANTGVGRQLRRRGVRGVRDPTRKGVTSAGFSSASSYASRPAYRYSRANSWRYSFRCSSCASLRRPYRRSSMLSLPSLESIRFRKSSVTSRWASSRCR